MLILPGRMEKIYRAHLEFRSREYEAVGLRKLEKIEITVSP